MAGVAALLPKHQFLDAAGAPLVNGTVEVYVAGSTTPTNTWQDPSLTILNTNPIVLDARGESLLWLDSTVVYKFVLKNAVGVTQWTLDNISSVSALADALRTDLADTTGAGLVNHSAALNYTAGTIGAVLNDVSINVKMFPWLAKGDGTTDDTAAINAALATNAKHVHIPHGDYVITDALQDGTPVLVSNLAGRTITCDGAITANTTVLRALGVYGANSNIQVNIDGNEKIANGIYIYAGGCVVHDCRISDLYSTTFSAIGVGSSALTGGLRVRDCTFTNINSVGNGSLGDGNGQSRAILLAMAADATSQSVFERNIIEDILGEEGDAITVIAGGSGTYYNARVVIRNNEISNFTRRAVKVQANRVRVLDNYFTHDFAASTDVPNAAAVIDFVQGGNNFAKRNTFDACKWFVQVSVFATGSDSFNNLFIDGNDVLGLGSETTGSCITVSPNGSNVFIRNNTLQCGTGRAISTGDITNLVISNNDIVATDNASERVISVASDVTGCVVSDNKLFGGVRQCFIGMDAPNGVTRDNDVKCNTPLYMNQAGGGNGLIIGNSIDGTAGMTTDIDTHTGNRFGGNYTFGNQANLYPGFLFTQNSSGPAVTLAGKYVVEGQSVIYTSASASEYIGWTALTTGLADSVTWRQFGAVVP